MSLDRRRTTSSLGSRELEVPFSSTRIAFGQGKLSGSAANVGVHALGYRAMDAPSSFGQLSRPHAGSRCKTGVEE
jgi:hypothetical protein